MNENTNSLMFSNLNRHSDEKKCKKKKCSFKDYKKNAFNSLNEVEFFLNNLDKAFKCLHVWKFFKK